MVTFEALCATLGDATKRFATTDSDVQEIQSEIFDILEAISPGSLRASLNPDDGAEKATHPQDPVQALPKALSLFHRVDEGDRHPNLFSFDRSEANEVSRPFSRKAMRLVYCVKILAEAASGVGGTDDYNMLKEEITTGQVVGSIAKDFYTPDLNFLEKEIENEIRELEKLD